jgi:tRNA(Ser,Leu) C12 N-acetylase TAN1
VSREAGLTVGRATALVVTTPAGLEAKARRELRGLLPGAEADSLPLKGNLLLLSDVPEQEALARIGGAETRFVAQVVAVQRQVRVTRDGTCFPAVAAAAADVGRLRAGESFVVRCRRRGQHDWSSRDLERAVARELEALTAAVGDYEREVDWLVTVQVYQNVAYVGVIRPATVIQKVPREQRKYAPGERPLNRAQWKVREALEVFGIALPTGARVLDLGSAPGGWALVLAEKAEEVVAVDPAELDASAVARPNIHHLRCRAEELVGREDLQGRFDLLTCDMNVDPSEAAAIVCGLAPMLRPGAPAIMTVKYTTRRRREHERRAREVLGAEFEEIRMRHLPHNAWETTAVMRRREATGNGPKYP